MTNRRATFTRAVSVERPRVKGWRDFDEYDESEAGPPAPKPEAARAAAAPERRHSITPVGRFLTPQQVELVRAVMRTFLSEDMARGVPADVRLRCHSCGSIKWAAGFVLYARSPFCNDCAADFELARLRNQCATAAEFLAQHADRAAG